MFSISLAQTDSSFGKQVSAFPKVHPEFHAVKGEVYNDCSLETGMAHHVGPHKGGAECIRRQKEQEKLWARAFIVVSM